MHRVDTITILVNKYTGRQIIGVWSSTTPKTGPCRRHDRSFAPRAFVQGILWPPPAGTPGLAPALGKEGFESQSVGQPELNVASPLLLYASAGARDHLLKREEVETSLVLSCPIRPTTPHEHSLLRTTTQLYIYRAQVRLIQTSQPPLSLTWNLQGSKHTAKSPHLNIMLIAATHSSDKHFLGKLAHPGYAPVAATARSIKTGTASKTHVVTWDY